MTNLFKQLWPLIKSKVKDPSLLIKTINSISNNDCDTQVEFQADVQIEQQSQIIIELE